VCGSNKNCPPFSVRPLNPEGGGTTRILNVGGKSLTDRSSCAKIHYSKIHCRIRSPPPPQWAPVTKILKVFLMSLMRAIRLANLLLFDLITVIIIGGRSQWPRGLRRTSAAASLLGMRVRIPLRAWIIVSF